MAFLNIYSDLGKVPQNRGGLFDEFVFQLLKREGLTQGDTPDAAGQVLRGGSWNYVSGSCRAAYRDHSRPANRLDLYGFRVLRPPSDGH